MERAVVPLTKIEYAYGFGVYENIRVVRGLAMFLSDHIDRLFLSANTIGLSHTLQKNIVERWVKELIEKVEDDAFNIKMLLIGGKAADDAMLSILPLKPRFPEKKLFTQGTTVTLAHYERLFPNAKTLNMLGSFMAYRDAKEAGAYDALLINQRNEIVEGTRTNFFLAEGKTIVSAPKEDILEGVTMKHVLNVARENGWSIVFEPITQKRMESSDGAFLTSTSSKIMPLVKIGNHALTIPESLRELMRAFDLFLESQIRS